jgi:hypothetical protein
MFCLDSPIGYEVPCGARNLRTDRIVGGSNVSPGKVVQCMTAETSFPYSLCRGKGALFASPSYEQQQQRDTSSFFDRDMVIVLVSSTVCKETSDSSVASCILHWDRGERLTVRRNIMYVGL